jgi:hypothetical protein
MSVNLAQVVGHTLPDKPVRHSLIYLITSLNSSYTIGGMEQTRLAHIRYRGWSQERRVPVYLW